MTRVSLSRRRLLAGAAGAVGIAVLQRVALTQIEVPPDPTKVPGRPLTALGQRSPFERPRRLVGGVTQGSSLTPLQDLCGIVTPSDLHYERHHAGVPAIDHAVDQELVAVRVDGGDAGVMALIVQVRWGDDAAQVLERRQ